MQCATCLSEIPGNSAFCSSCGAAVGGSEAPTFTSSPERVRPPSTAPIDEYECEAATLLEAWRNGDPAALKHFHEHLPRMLDDKIRWLPKRLTVEELRAEVFDLADARAAIAHLYDFADWESLRSFASAMLRRDPSVTRLSLPSTRWWTVTSVRCDDCSTSIQICRVRDPRESPISIRRCIGRPCCTM